ncbi:MAG: MBG domain-containing protein [bacterium]|nr:MBG domain-containing protein [bacterium]
MIQKRRKGIFVILSVIFVASLIISAAVMLPNKASAENQTPEASQEVSVWDGTSDTSWYSYSKNTAVLNTAAELKGFADMANAGFDFSPYTIKLGANMDLNGLDWFPIENYGGVFDGQGYTLSNANIVSKHSNGSGFFGTLDKITVIKNVIFKNITAKSDVFYNYAIVAGKNTADGTIIENVSVRNCLVDTSATYNGDNRGGFFLSESTGAIRVSGCSVYNSMCAAGYKPGLVASKVNSETYSSVIENFVAVNAFLIDTGNEAGYIAPNGNVLIESCYNNMMPNGLNFENVKNYFSAEQIALYNKTMKEKGRIVYAWEFGKGCSKILSSVNFGEYECSEYFLTNTEEYANIIEIPKITVETAIPMNIEVIVNGVSEKNKKTTTATTVLANGVNSVEVKLFLNDDEVFSIKALLIVGNIVEAYEKNGGKIEDSSAFVSKSRNEYRVSSFCGGYTLKPNNAIEGVNVTVNGGDLTVDGAEFVYNSLSNSYTAEVIAEYGGKKIKKDYLVWKDSKVVFDGLYAWTAGSLNGIDFYRSTNQGVQSSISSISIVVADGKTVSFKYHCSSENNYDYLFFYVNGVVNLNTRGKNSTLTEQDIFTKGEWTNYSYSNKTGEDAVLTLSYKKDISGDKGSDTAYIKDIVCTDNAEIVGQSVQSVVNSCAIFSNVNVSSSISFTGDYPWEYVTTGDYYRSTNKGKANTQSDMLITIPANTVLRFVYACSSENNYDYLYFKCGENVTNTKGKNCQLSTDEAVLNEASVWKEYIYTNKSDVPVQIQVYYKKDGSGDVGSDTAYIKDISLNDINVKINLNVEIDGNGSVYNIYDFKKEPIADKYSDTIWSIAQLFFAASDESAFEYVGYRIKNSDGSYGELITTNGAFFVLSEDITIKVEFEERLPLSNSIQYIYTKDGNSTDNSLGMFETIEFTENQGEADLIFKTPVIDLEGVTVSARDSALGDSLSLIADNGMYVYRITELSVNRVIEFVYEKNGYLSTKFRLFISYEPKIEDYLISNESPLPVEILNNDSAFNYVYGEEVSSSDRYAFKSSLSKTDFTNKASNIGFKVYGTGLLVFDYYLNSEIKPEDYAEPNMGDKAFYGINTKIETSMLRYSSFILDEYKGKVGYLGAELGEDNYAYCQGALGWRSAAIPVNASEEAPAIVYIAYVKDGSDVVESENIFAIANVMFVTGDYRVNYSSNSTKASVSAVYGNDVTVENGATISAGSKITFTTSNTDVSEKFVGWTVDGIIRSRAASFTISLTGELSVTAVYTNEKAKIFIGASYFETMKEAIDSLWNGSSYNSATIRILADYTLTENVTIPEGVTVILPYALDDMTGYKQGGTTTRVSWNAGILPYVTLTVNNGVTLTVNGELIVGGVQHGSDQNATGRTCGNYAKLVNNGNLVINGKMDVRGLVTGDGTLTVNSGAELKQPFMVNNYSGGTNTSALYSAGQFPFVQFATVNVQCKQVIDYGAKVIGSTSLYFWGSITTQDVNLVYPKGGSSEGSLIWMEEGSRLEITYNNKTINQTVGNIHLGDSGVCTIAVYGNITAGEFYLIGYGSAEMVLSIPYTYNFELKSGSKVTLAHKYKIMPGAVVTVEQGAELNITAAGGLYVYDGLIQSDKSGKSYPSASILGERGFDKSGMLVVNGKLTIDGLFAGIVQTSGNGEIAVASGATVGEQTIADGCSGGYTDNTTKFRMTGRVYGLNGFMSLQPGKTYKAYVAEEFTLVSFTVDEAARMSELTVTLNQKMTGRFLEFDGENFVSEVEFAVGLEDGKTIYINGAAYVVTGGKVTVKIAFGADGKFTYYTGEFETSSAAHEGVIELDGATELTKAVTGVALSETNVYEIAEGESFALKAVITYADGSTEEVALTNPNFTTYVLKNASLTSEKLAVPFTKDLAIVKTVLSDYISSVEALGNNQDDVVEAAKNCYAAHTSLIGGLNADDLEFVTAKIGDKQAYASEIAKEISVEDYSFTYGDADVPATLTMIDGTKKPAMAGVIGYIAESGVIYTDVVYQGEFNGLAYRLYQRRVLVKPVELSVIWTVGSYTYNGTEHKPEATLSGVLAKDNGRVSVVVTGAVNAGEQTAITTLTGERAGYYAIKTADSTKKFTIGKASANVKVNDKEGVTTSFTAIEFEVTESGLIDVDSLTYEFKIYYNNELIATANANGVLTFEDGKTLTPGIYTVEAFSENANYDVTFENGSLTVEATDTYYTVSFAGEGKATFTGGVFNPEVKAVVTETGEEETNIIVSHGDIRNAGVYEVTVKVGALEKVYRLQFVVEAKPIELEWNVYGFVYNGSAQKPSVAVKQGEIADGNIVTVNVSTASSAINAGTYTATATLGGENAGNYVITNATAEFAITPASVEVTIEEATSVYGENAANIRFNTTSELYGKKLSDIAEAVCEVTSSSAVGTYEITLNGKDENYAITYEKGRYLVTKRAITVTIDNKTSAYGEAFAELTAKVTSGSIVNGDENVFTIVKESGATVGEYAIYVNESLNNANYEIIVTNGVYTITKRNITVKVNNSVSVYGEEFAALTSDITSGSLAEGDGLNGVVRLAKASCEEVGVYAITAENVNANYNVTFVYTEGDHSVYEITKREVVLTIKDGEFSYTEDIADMKLEIAVKNGYSLKAGETLEDLNLAYTIKQNGVLLTNKTLRGGEWKFEATFDNGNYSITFENADDENLAYGILTITKPVLELADLTAEHTYSGEAFGYYDYESAVTVKANSTADDFACELYFKGEKVSEMKNAGTYTVRVILKSAVAFALKDGTDGNNYKDFTVVVHKKDVTNEIEFVCEGSVATENGIYVPLGNYTSIGTSLKNTDIGYAEHLTFGGAESELAELGEYKYKVTVTDDNYSGEKEFTLVAVMSIEVKSSNLKKYTAEYNENRTNANADKVRGLLSKLTDSDRILFTNEMHAGIYEAAAKVEGAHVEYLKTTLTEKIEAFEEKQSYESILQARKVALDLMAFKAGEGEEQIAAYEAAWNEYCENLTSEGAAASGIADYMALAAAMTTAAAAMAIAMKKFVL